MRNEHQEFFYNYKPFEYKYKGYTVKQSNYNYHYIVCNENDHMVMHCQYDKPLTEDTAKEIVDFYIMIRGDNKNEND